MGEKLNTNPENATSDGSSNNWEVYQKFHLMAVSKLIKDR